MSTINGAVWVFIPEIVCAPVVLTTVESTVILSAFAVMPSPPMTFKVTVPLVPPPVMPVPAVTPVISPTGTPATALSTYVLFAASVPADTVSIPCILPVPDKTIPPTTVTPVFVVEILVAPAYLKSTVFTLTFTPVIDPATNLTVSAADLYIPVFTSS